MKRCGVLITLILLSQIALALTDATGRAATVRDTSSVVTLGGDLTEIVFALGEQEHLIAVDRAERLGLDSANALLTFTGQLGPLWHGGCHHHARRIRCAPLP